MHKSAWSPLLNLPIKENKLNNCNCSYFRAKPQVIFSCLHVQENSMLIIIIESCIVINAVRSTIFTRKNDLYHSPEALLIYWEFC